MDDLIVIVEDDRQIRNVVEAYLRQAGYPVLSAGDGVAGLALIQREKPVLAVLDVMLPGLDGWEITRRLRGSSDPTLAGVYVIMLTARVEEPDRLVGFDAGADDYVPKPFSPRELMARVRAALRRISIQAEITQARPLRAGELSADPVERTVYHAGERLELTATEFDLLCHLMRHPGRVFSRSELLDVTTTDASGDAAFERTVDAHIKNLRHKLGDAGRSGRYIETVHGVGYRFLSQGA